MESLRNPSPRRAAIRTAVLVAAVLAGTAFAPARAQEGDPARAKGKISMCIGCHGIPSYRTAFPEVYSVPMIGGQNPGYIAAALKEYRTGARSHPTMRGIAATLTDQDVADLAAYYGAKPAAKGGAQ